MDVVWYKRRVLQEVDETRCIGNWCVMSDVSYDDRTHVSSRVLIIVERRIDLEHVWFRRGTRLIISVR